MQVNKRNAGNIVRKLQIDEISCKHHHAGFLVVDGMRVLKVHYSLGAGDMPPTVAHLFRKSLKLSMAEFQKLVGCTLTREDYLQILREKGYLRSQSQTQ
jgi:hypothetical protein